MPDPNKIRLSILEGRPCGVDVKHERWYPDWSHLMCFRGWNQLPGLTAWDDWAENSPQRLHQPETHRRLWQHYEGTDSSVWSLHVYDSDSYLVSLARLLSVFRESAYLCPCRQEEMSDWHVKQPTIVWLVCSETLHRCRSIFECLFTNGISCLWILGTEFAPVLLIYRHKNGISSNFIFNCFTLNMSDITLHEPH